MTEEPNSMLNELFDTVFAVLVGHLESELDCDRIVKLASALVVEVSEVTGLKRRGRGAFSLPSSN